ncbi:RHS repeat-associated core domain-containing protein, partial [Acinetobacter pittii]|uniref:RHS repeat-associated core domain-containing protein n=1 Tax=Acinetobacter pittii TaxID=48296 RepID=UPI00300A205F
HTANAELIYGGFTPTYDNAGNRREDKTTGGAATAPQYYMTYNHKNERTVRGYTANSTAWKANAVQFVYDENSHLIGEYNADGVPLVEYVWLGDKPVAAIYGSGTATKTYWIATDAQNTPRRLINAADGTTTVWAWDSTAFGVGLPSVQTVKFNLRFPGQYYDEVTKQHYNHNRFYNPVLGRYVEPDRIGLEGGLNPYIYVDSNPINSIDVTGLAARVVNGYWVDDGSNFYTATGGSFTDRLSENFASDVATLAPLPKFNLFSKELSLVSKISPITSLNINYTGNILVWDWIKPTQPLLKGTYIPKSFEMATNTRNVWVHPNATKHMQEYLTRNTPANSLEALRRINNQAMLLSFHSAVNTALTNGVKYNQIMNVGQWELKFSMKAKDKFPVVMLAVYK